MNILKTTGYMLGAASVVAGLTASCTKVPEVSQLQADKAELEYWQKREQKDSTILANSHSTGAKLDMEKKALDYSKAAVLYYQQSVDSLSKLKQNK